MTTISLHQPYVYTRRRWADDWVHNPDLFALIAEDDVAPSLPTARFLWLYGNKSIDSAAFVSVAPEDLVGKYVQIRRPLTALERSAYPDAVPPPVWAGRFTAEGDGPGGFASEDILESDLPPTGHQVYTARGLAIDLHRARIYGSVVYLSGSATRIDSVFNFNVSTRRGGPPVGNRSSAKHSNPANGLSSYVFADSTSSDVKTWTSADIIEYLLTWFAPVEQKWTLIGQKTILGAFTNVITPGRSVAATIDQLVDRRNGAAWSTPGSLDEPAVQIASLLSEDTVVGGSTLPANDGAGPFDPNIEAVETLTVNRSTEHRYTRIIARGDRLVLCGSFTVGDGADITWDSAAQTAYKAATDAQRVAEKFKHVWTTHILTDPTGAGTRLFYDGNGARNGTCPSVAVNGQLDVTKPAPIFLSEKTLLRQLPILTGYTYSGGSVILSDQSDPHEFFPPFVLVKGEIKGEAAYGFVDRPSTLDGRLEAPGMSLTMLDDAPGFRIKAKIPHMLALNSFGGAGPSNIAPQYDYRDMVATVAIASDVHLQIVRNVGSANEADDAEPSQTLVIDVRGAEAWYICAGTIVDCIDGKLIRTPTGIVARNDSADLEAIAALAVAWYKRDRRALTVKFKTPFYDLTPGDMITTIDPEDRTIEINSIVTRVRWDFKNATTVVQTDFAELDFVGFGKRGGGSTLSGSNRPLTRDMTSNNSPVRIGDPGLVDNPGFVGVLGTAVEESTNRYRYPFTEVELSGTGSSATWITRPNGKTGNARNRLEYINTGVDAHIEGNGVDPANLDPAATGSDTFSIMPITEGNPVWIRDHGDGEYWFEIPQGVNGDCGS